jgi:hypothetical protein
MRRTKVLSLRAKSPIYGGTEVVRHYGEPLPCVESDPELYDADRRAYRRARRARGDDGAPRTLNA